MTSLLNISPSYHHESLQAIGNGDDLLALCWRIVQDLAKNISQHNEPNEILSLSLRSEKFHTPLRTLDSLFFSEYRHLIEPARKIFYSSNDCFLANRFKISQQKKQKKLFEVVAQAYRACILQSVSGGLTSFQQDVKELSEAAKKYQLLAPEASFYAAEAADAVQKAYQLAGEGRLLEACRWKITGSSALEAAITYLHVEASLSWKNKILLHHWREAARYGEFAFHFRMKSAIATQQGNEMDAIHWSLTAGAATKVSNAHKNLLKIFPRGDECLITDANNLLYAAEQAMEIRKKTSTQRIGNKYFSAQAAFWSEHYDECCTKVMETHLPSLASVHNGWKQAACSAKKVAFYWSQAAKHEDKKGVNLLALYDQYRADYHAASNRIMIAFLLQ